jgi:glutamyl/glutaminyl-tRNA synthetase
VREKLVSGWDDPRMPTLAGLRRRGVPPEAIRDFVKRVGVAKANSVVDAQMFDHAVREYLNTHAQRRMAVLNPLKVVLENYPENQIEELEAVNNPEDPSAGTRRIPFGRELFIEREDFMENPPKKFFRLSPGAEVRLYNPLFTRSDPSGDIRQDINPNSLQILSDARIEPALANAEAGEAIQFERQGYFTRDQAPGHNHAIFNRTVGLRDSK